MFIKPISPVKPILAAALLLLASCGQKTLTSYVNPMVGTDGHGHTFPGAIVPFGMIQPSPDTRLEGWDGCSAYHYSDDTIYGFSHTHLSGTGCEDYGDVLLMPVTGSIDAAPGRLFREAYKSAFRHKNETARAGYYKVLLDRSNTIVELTADRRVAYHAYTYADDNGNAFVIDLRHRDVLLSGKVMARDGMLVGWRESSAWNPDQHLHFAIRSDVPWESVLFSEDSTQAVVRFPRGTKHVELQVAISGVDINGAIGNLILAKYHTFDEARRAADQEWEQALGKLKVEGGTKEQRRCFYTALYHCMTSPYLWSDADGRYRGTDNQIHVVDEGREVYTVFSLWDTYRALHPLLTQIEPERTVDFVYTAMKNFEQGDELPMWELASHETHCMIGYHAVPMMLEAYNYLHDDDGTLAGYTPSQLLAAMVATSNRTAEHRTYAARGYLSSEVDNESVSKTLEYAYDDWCIAQMARIAGDKAVEREYWIRSQSWQNVMDEDGFMHARRNGGFVTPFDPTEVNNHFTEANSWQYSSYVPHDLDQWAARLGGPECAIEFLDSLFEGHNAMSGRDQADVTGLIGMYAHGNEPSHHAAWLYAFYGHPEETGRYVHKILNEMYTSAPDGLCGNEDCGQMSAWYVLASLGLYEICPGSGIWTRIEPVFANELDWALASDPRGEGLVCPDSLRITPVPVADDWQMRYVGDEHGQHNVSLSVPGNCDARIYYADVDHKFWREPYGGTIKAGTWVAAYAESEGRLPSHVVEMRYAQVQTDRHVTYLTQPAPQYTENGPEGMVDNIYGTTNYRIGGWQGWQGDMVAVVELDKEQNVKMVGLNCLENMRSWIFYPKNVKIEYSTDGENWQLYGTVPELVEAPESESAQQRQGESTTQLFAVVKEVRAKFFRLTAVNYGPLPEWHASAGEQAWLFADEIVIL